MGLGEIGLTPDQFWHLTFWEWIRTATGYRNRQNEFWRMNRQLATLTYNINVDKKDRITPEEYMPLPGDDKIKRQASAHIPPQVFIQMLNDAFGNLAEA